MIKDVPLTGVFVNDQQAALDFYTNGLEFSPFQYSVFYYRDLYRTETDA